jgi:hypothetical protein
MLYMAGTPGTEEVLIQARNRVLYYSGSEDTVSQRWAKRWITRNKDYWKTLIAKPFSAKRRAAHIQEDIDYHFREFDRTLALSDLVLLRTSSPRNLAQGSINTRQLVILLTYIVDLVLDLTRALRTLLAARILMSQIDRNAHLHADLFSLGSKVSSSDTSESTISSRGASSTMLRGSLNNTLKRRAGRT